MRRRARFKEAVMDSVKEQSSRFEDRLRTIVDTTPALIHTGRPDGYLDYFNRGWLDLLEVIRRSVWLALDRIDSSRRCRWNSPKMACGFGKRRAVRSRSARSVC